MLYLKDFMLSSGVLLFAGFANAMGSEEVEGPPPPPTEEQTRAADEEKAEVERERSEAANRARVGLEVVLSGGPYLIQVEHSDSTVGHFGGGLDGGAEVGVRFGDHWSVRARGDLLLGLPFLVLGFEGLVEWTPVVHWSLGAGFGYQAVSTCCAMNDVTDQLEPLPPPRTSSGPRFPVALWWNFPRGNVPFGHALRLGVRVVPQIGEDDRDMPFSISESLLIGYIWR